MSDYPQSTLPPTPDRLFGRAAKLGLVAILGLTALLHVAEDRAFERTAALSERAMVGATQSLATREIVAKLDIMARVEGGDVRRGAAFELDWRLEQLKAYERQLVELGGALAGSAERLGLLGGAAALIDAEGEGLKADAAARLRTIFSGQLAPEYAALAFQLGVEAQDARTRLRTWRRWLLAGQILGWLALTFGILRPSAAQLRTWVGAADAAAREANFRLLHDETTEMPNAAYLKAHLAHLAAGIGRGEGETAVLKVGLDRFAQLRETLGQRSADEILRVATRRIKRCLRAGDFAAYLGQDGFVVVAVELEDAKAVAVIAQRLQSALGKPFALGGGVQRLTASIGVTLLSDDLPEAERILGNAEIAQSEARAIGTGQLRFFCESMRRQVEAREALYIELSGGIGRGEIVPFFQPQMDLQTGAFAGFEALARWLHPRRGILGPAVFLEFADQTDLTERIGDAILNGTLGAMKAWDAAGLVVPRVGVNFSLGQLRDPQLIERIKWEVERFDIAPERLAIEVLETVLIRSDADPVVRNLRGLASAGFHIELDDFGTGHAAISNLRRFTVERVKIDRSFIDGIETSLEQQKLTASMVALARALGIPTLAEGVETEAAKATLRSLGCEYAQGYLFAKPMSFEDTLRWLGEFETGARRRAAAPGGAPVGAPRGHPGADPNMP